MGVVKRTFMPTLLLTTGIISSIYYFAGFSLLVALLIYQHRGKVRRGAIRSIWPLVLVIAAGLVGINTENTTNTMRDFWYFSKIFLIALTGLLIGTSYSSDPRFMRRVTSVAIILVFFNIGYAVFGPDAENSRNLSYFAVFMMPFIWRYWYSSGLTGRVMAVAVTASTLVMIVMSGSRAGFLVFAISSLAAFGVFNKMSKAILLFGTFVIFAVSIWPMLPQYDIYNITFVGKIQNTFNELSFETGEDRLEMYANWRGFEAFRAYQTWLNASILEKIVGLGHGAGIDLGKVVAYGSGEVEKLPFAHNAYFTLLVKTGAIGTAAMIYFLLGPFRINFDSTDREALVLSQLSRGAAVVLLVTMAFISGPLNKHSMDGVLLIWAWSLGSLIRLKYYPVSNQNYTGTTYANNTTAAGHV